ncbi:hypothetical protein FOL47_006614 [Perkinsus chesapeaki]|uniref:Transmembrane protein n=1 Tax=Perkinsus chesapeaki TaxID=330153 RepID=A0A7J6LQX9_PERCH|nr:hypothetical protein FOL47_006614 [Perkinsus chesapeaki]
MGGDENDATLTVRVLSPADSGSGGGAKGSVNEVSVKMKPKHKLDKLLRSWCKHQQVGMGGLQGMIPPDTVKLMNAERTEELLPTTRAGDLPDPKTVYAVPKHFVPLSTCEAEAAKKPEASPAPESPAPSSATPPTPMNVSVVLQQKDDPSHRIDVTLPGAVKWSRMLKAWVTKYPSHSDANITFLLLPDREEIDMSSAVEHVVMGDGHFCRIEVVVEMAQDKDKAITPEGTVRVAVVNEITGKQEQITVPCDATRSALLEQIGQEGPCEIFINGRLVEGAYLTGITSEGGTSTVTIRPARPTLLSVKVKDRRTGIRRSILCSHSATIGDVLGEWRRSVDTTAAGIEPLGVDARMAVSGLPYVKDPYSLLDDDRQYTLEINSVTSQLPPVLLQQQQQQEEEEPLGFDFPIKPTTYDAMPSQSAPQDADESGPPREKWQVPSKPARDDEPAKTATRGELANSRIKDEPKGPPTYLVTVKDMRDSLEAEPREEVFRMKARCAWKKMTKRFSASVEPKPGDSAVYRLLLPSGGIIDINDDEQRVYQTLEDGRLVGWKEGDEEPELDVHLMLRQEQVARKMGMDKKKAEGTDAAPSLPFPTGKEDSESDIEAAVEESRAQQKAVGATYSNDWSGILWFIAWWGFILVASLWWLSRKKAWLTREKQQRFEELVYGGAGAVARFVNQRLPRTVRRSSSGVIDHAHMTRLSEMPFDDLAAPRNGTSTQIVGRRTTPEGSVGSTTPPLQE